MNRTSQVTRRILAVLGILGLIIGLIAGILDIGRFLEIIPPEITLPKVNLAVFGTFFVWLLIIIIACLGIALVGYGVIRIIRFIGQNTSGRTWKRI